MSDAEDELTRARKAQIAAETRVLELEGIVETVERQRDHADRLLLNLLDAVHSSPAIRKQPAYTRARAYACRVATVDKYERRLV